MLAYCRFKLTKTDNLAEENVNKYLAENPEYDMDYIDTWVSYMAGVTRVAIEQDLSKDYQKNFVTGKPMDAAKDLEQSFTHVGIKVVMVKKPAEAFIKSIERYFKQEMQYLILTNAAGEPDAMVKVDDFSVKWLPSKNGDERIAVYTWLLRKTPSETEGE